jgi:hypothetical protein
MMSRGAASCAMSVLACVLMLAVRMAGLDGSCSDDQLNRHPREGGDPVTCACDGKVAGFPP